MSLNSLTTQINKKYKTNLITKGSHVVDIPRIPTGSFSLDVETGGGIPTGRITTFSGHFSDGKTSIVLKVVAEFQKKWPEKEIVWMDAEGAWDDRWAATLGVDTDNVYLVSPEYSQQAFDIAEQCISHDVGLLVIDSVAALVPKEEAEATMEEWQVGLAARVNNKFIRKMHSALNSSRIELAPTIILINQLRENIGYGAAESEPGGKGIGFASAMKVKLRRGDLYPKAKSNYDQSVVPKAQQIKFYVEKNKTAPPQTRGHIWFYFDTLDEYRKKGQYDRIEEIIRYARKYEITVQRGSIFDLPSPNGTGEILSFKGSTALAEYIRKDKDTREWIEQKVTEKVNDSYAETKELLSKETKDKDSGEEVSKES